MGTSLHPLPSQPKTIAKMNFLVLTLLATGSSALTLTKDLKAASPFVNLGCQCGSLTFVDSHGQVQGNCRSVDSTGARWCYVDHLPSSCQDLSHSARFPNNPWSYEACSTPPEHSGGHHHHQPAYTAPLHQHPASPSLSSTSLSTMPLPTLSQFTSPSTSTAHTLGLTRTQVHLLSKMRQHLVKRHPI